MKWKMRYVSPIFKLIIICMIGTLISFFSDIAMAKTDDKIVCSEDHPDWSITRQEGAIPATLFNTHRPSLAKFVVTDPADAHNIWGFSFTFFLIKRKLNGYNEKKLELFGLPGISLDYDMLDDGMDGHMRGYYIFNGDNFYSIVYGVKKSDFENELPLFDSFLKTCDIKYGE